MPDAQLHLTRCAQRLDSHTRLQAAGADNVLIISTTLAGLTLRSIYTGAGLHSVTHITRLALHRHRPPALTHQQIPGDQLPVTHARQLCLADHAAALRDQLGDSVTVGISDRAAAQAAQTF